MRVEPSSLALPESLGPPVAGSCGEQLFLDEQEAGVVTPVTGAVLFCFVFLFCFALFTIP
jgi:hypothetical protein